MSRSRRACIRWGRVGVSSCSRGRYRPRFLPPLMGAGGLGCWHRSGVAGTPWCLQRCCVSSTRSGTVMTMASRHWASLLVPNQGTHVDHGLGVGLV